MTASRPFSRLALVAAALVATHLEPAPAGARAVLDAGSCDACAGADASGLSLRSLTVRKASAAGHDKWSGEADVETTTSPSFLDDVDSGGLTLSLARHDGTPVDAVAFGSSECARTGANSNSLRCRNALGSEIRFNKRTASGFFRLRFASKRRSLVLPGIGDPPLRVTVTSPGPVDRSDEITYCAVRSDSVKCKDLP